MFAKDKLQQVKNLKICDFSRFSIDRFSNELSEVNWNQIIANGTNGVHKLFSLFCNKYNTIVNKHAPMKKLSNHKTKQLSKPWLTNGIKVVIKVKNKLYETGDKVRYKQYGNKICTLIRICKRRCYDMCFENNMGNMKKTWQGINELLHRWKNINIIEHFATDLLTTCLFPKNIV